MAIKINDIPPEGLRVELADTLDLFEEGISATSFTAQVTLRSEGGGTIHIQGTVDATTELECSRCLRRFPFTVNAASVDLDLVPEGSLKIAPEHELGKGELDVEFYQGGEIEPRDIIREQLLLAVPMIPVHSPDCKGLCPVCGTDRNERACSCRQDTMPEKENPFAVLKQIIKPEKE